MTTFQAPLFCTFWYQSLSENRKLIISGLLIAYSRRYLVQNPFFSSTLQYLLKAFHFPGASACDEGMCWELCPVPDPQAAVREEGIATSRWLPQLLAQSSHRHRQSQNLWCDVNVHRQFTKMLRNTYVNLVSKANDFTLWIVEYFSCWQCCVLAWSFCFHRFPELS